MRDMPCWSSGSPGYSVRPRAATADSLDDGDTGRLTSRIIGEVAVEVGGVGFSGGTVNAPNELGPSAGMRDSRFTD